MADWIWGGEWGRSRMGVLDDGGDHQRGRGSFGGKCGVIVTNGDFLA